MAVAVLAAGAFWYLRGRNSPPIAAAGGKPFASFAAIETPFYLQRDERWQSDTIRSGETLAKVGCTVSSLAMALEHYGVHFTPQTLNAALMARDGYTPRGWLKWEAVGRLSDGKVSVRIPVRPSHADLDAALEARRPVLAKVFINHVIPHWVLIVGKEGTDYLMRDPLGDGKNLSRVASYQSDIYGVRIIEPVRSGTKSE